LPAPLPSVTQVAPSGRNGMDLELLMIMICI
jgi:hypothetical protein